VPIMSRPIGYASMHGDATSSVLLLEGVPSIRASLLDLCVVLNPPR